MSFDHRMFPIQANPIHKLMTLYYDAIDNKSDKECKTAQSEFYNEIISSSIDCNNIPILIPQNISTKYKQIHSKYKSLINGYIQRQGEVSFNYKIFSNIPNSIQTIITLFYTSFKSQRLYGTVGWRENDKQCAVNTKYKLLIDGFMRSHASISCDYSLFENIPTSIHETIKGFYPSVISVNKNKLLNNFPTLLKGFNSTHYSTHLISTDNIHKLLSTSISGNDGLDLEIFQQVIDMNMIQCIFHRFKNLVLDESDRINIKQKGFDSELAIKYLQILR